MIYQFTVTLRGCGSCVSHSHCSTCCEQIAEDLLAKANIQAVSLGPLKKLLIITSPADEDSIVDLLDDMGIFTV